MESGSLAGISLLVVMSSLFLIPGNLSLHLRKGFAISALNPPGGFQLPRISLYFPCGSGFLA
jgi:hypothetical protein